jgi:predicted RNase H-like nuclease (RuvC/YqgF family)
MFCVKCVEKESEIETLRNQHHKESQCMKEQINRLKHENEKLNNLIERLTLDIAFYNKDFLTSNNK